MRQILFLILLFATHFVPLSAQSRPEPTINAYFSARQYDDYQGAARVAQIQQLQKNDWQALDSMYGLPDENGKSSLEISKTDLAPFVNDDGHIIYLAPEVAPLFPGDKKALQQYKFDALAPLSSGPGDEVQKSVYIKCIIGTDGRVTAVKEAQSHYGMVPDEVLQRCLDAVRYMPVWSPGLFHGKPVNVGILLEFSLKE